MALTDTQLGGGLFTGRATYSDGAFRGVKEDVSQAIGMISPRETPLLSIFGDSEYPAKSLYHEWLEESLNPTVLEVMTGAANQTTDSDLVFKNNGASGLLPGSILSIAPVGSGEYVQVVSKASDTTVKVSRGFGGSTVAQIADDVQVAVIHRAGVDGQDVLSDTSRPRIRKGNLVANFFYEIIVSDTHENTTQHGGIASDFDHQARNRLVEALTALERSVILSRAHTTQNANDPGGLTGTNVIGGRNTTRTFKGLRQLIDTNKWESLVVPADRAAASLNTFEDQLIQITEAPYRQGATDCNLMVVGDLVKRRFDLLNANRSRTNQQERLFTQLVDRYENQYGSYTVMQNRWMPRTELLLLAPSRIKLCPLQNSSFHKERVARTGTATKGFINGEYTLVLKNEEGMARANWPALLTSGNAALLAP